jgi:hypothetical protein
MQGQQRAVIVGGGIMGADRARGIGTPEGGRRKQLA